MNYIVRVRETYEANVIVEADSEAEAEELADEMSVEGVVDIVSMRGTTKDGKLDRTTECVGTTDEAPTCGLEQHGRKS